MGKKRDFIQQFFKEKKTVGAISPSSKFLAKKMMENINFDDSKVIVELGAGTGVFTRKLLRNLPNDGKLFVFELHKPFYKKLANEFKNDERIVLINDNAEKIRVYLQEYNYDYADVILSSLPLANFKKELVLEILKNSYLSLKNDGLYVQFQYSLKSKKRLFEIFDEVDLTFTPRNIPPAFVYTCKKNKPKNE